MSGLIACSTSTCCLADYKIEITTGCTIVWWCPFVCSSYLDWSGWWRDRLGRSMKLCIRPTKLSRIKLTAYFQNILFASSKYWLFPRGYIWYLISCFLCCRTSCSKKFTSVVHSKNIAKEEKAIKNRFSRTYCNGCGNRIRS